MNGPNETTDVEKKNLLERLNEFYKNNKESIAKYATVPIAAVSLPAAGIYHAHRKGSSKVLLGMLGIVEILAIGIAVTVYQRRDLEKHVIENVKITNYYDSDSATKDISEYTTTEQIKGISALFLTNMGVYSINLQEETSSIKVEKDIPNKNIEGINITVSGTYKVKGFKKPNDLKNIDLPKPEKLTVGGYELITDKDKNFYDSLCRAEVKKVSQKL